MDRMQRFGAEQASFQQNAAAAEALIALQAKRYKIKGDAEHSTQEKMRAIKALRVWYVEFCKLARIAFQDTPQILESFGMVVYASKRKRKVVPQEEAA